MVEIGLSNYYVVDERALRSCGINMTTSEDWTRLSWTSVWTSWVALAAICVFLLLKFMVSFLRQAIRKSKKSQGISSLSKEKSGTGSAASNSAIRIVDDELAHVMELLNDGDGQSDGSNEQWEAVIDKQSGAVAYTAKRRDPKDGGATEYLSITVFENCSTKLVRDYYMDSDYRAEWDKTLIQHRQLEVCPGTGTEIGLMVKKFPLLTPRDYVLAWRLWEGDDGTYYCVLKACEHKDAPRQAKYKRVEVYNSGWRIRKVAGRVAGRDACEVKMIHQEDTGMQREMAKVAFRRGIWSYILKMDIHLRKYALRPNSLANEVNAVSLAHKVPEALRVKYLATDNTSEIPQEGDLDALTPEGGKLQRLSSKRKLAKGLLLVGGALFFTQGSASLGAKIAAVCIMNRAMRPQGASNFLQRFIDRV